MPSKHHIPQLFLKLLWTRRTWGEYKIKSTNYVSYSKLNHCECREAKQLKRGCVGVHVILGTRWRMCATVLASAHEVIMPGHAGTHRTTSQVVLASTSATCALTLAECSPGIQLFFALVSFIYSNTPCKITQSWRPISFTHISSSQSHFPLFQLFTMDKEEWDRKKNVFLIFPASSSKHKKIGCFSLGSLPVLNQILIKIKELLPKSSSKNLYVSA